MKVFLSIMGIILSCSFYTLQAMGSGKSIVQLVETLDSINYQLIDQLINLTPESLPALVKNFTEQLSKNYQKNNAAFQQALVTLQNNKKTLDITNQKPPETVSPEEFAQFLELFKQIPSNVSDINGLIERILPKEIIPLFFFFVIHNNPQQFLKERNLIRTLINPLAKTIIDLNDKLTEMQLDVLFDTNTSLAFLISFNEIIENPEEKIKQNNLIINALMNKGLKQQTITDLKALLNNIDTASELELQVGLHRLLDIAINIHLFNTFMSNIPRFIFNDVTVINNLKMFLINSMNQFKNILEFIQQPTMWNKLQAKKDLQNITLMQDLTAYQLLQQLKNKTISSQDIDDTAKIFDFYINLFKNKKFSYQEWTTIENTIKNLIAED